MKAFCAFCDIKLPSHLFLNKYFILTGLKFHSQRHFLLSSDPNSVLARLVLMLQYCARSNILTCRIIFIPFCYKHFVRMIQTKHIVVTFAFTRNSRAFFVCRVCMIPRTTLTTLLIARKKSSRRGITYLTQPGFVWASPKTLFTNAGEQGSMKIRRF